nr:unnamed protein product [Digitaria exilis]
MRGREEGTPRGASGGAPAVEMPRRRCRCRPAPQVEILCRAAGGDAAPRHRWTSPAALQVQITCRRVKMREEMGS